MRLARREVDLCPTNPWYWNADPPIRQVGDLITTRAALFFDQRRWRHFGYEPEGEAEVYIRALVVASAT